MGTESVGRQICQKAKLKQSILLICYITNVSEAVQLFCLGNRMKLMEDNVDSLISHD